MIGLLKEMDFPLDAWKSLREKGRMAFIPCFHTAANEPENIQLVDEYWHKL